MKHSGLIITAIVLLLLTIVGVGIFVAPLEQKARVTAYLGDPSAQWLLGRKALLGEGRAKNEEEGAAWIKKSADGGSPRAQYLWGLLQLAGIGTAQDLDAAIYTLERAPSQAARQLAAGLRKAQANYARMPQQQSFEQQRKHMGDLARNLRFSLALMIQDIEKSAPVGPVSKEK